MSSKFSESCLRWQKSTRSSAESSNCVEVADAGHVIAIRDSKNPNGPRHAFNRLAFVDLARRIKADMLDL